MVRMLFMGNVEVRSGRNEARSELQAQLVVVPLDCHIKALRS